MSVFGYIPQYSSVSPAQLQQLGYYPGKNVVTSLSSTATLTTAQSLGGMVLANATAGAITLTSPTAAAMVAAMNSPQAGTSFILHIRNTAGAANNVTLAGGTGVTVSGTPTVAQNNCKSFLCIVDDASAGSEAITAYSLGTAAF